MQPTQTGTNRSRPEAVDLSVLQSLTSRLGDRGPALLVRLLDTWEAETTTRLAELRTAVAQDDPADVARIAHSIRGGSASLGAVRLAQVCGEAETSIRAGQQVDLAAAERTIASEVEAARSGLAQLRVGSGG